MGKFELLFRLNKKALDFAGFFISIKRVPHSLMTRKYRKFNNEIMNYRNGDTCYVIGLGPSLKDVDFNKICGDTFVVNSFFKVEGCEKINPTYYCIMDNEEYINPDSKILKYAAEKFPQATFLLNGKYVKEAENILNNSGVKRYYINNWKGHYTKKKNIDLCKNVPAAYNIVAFSILSAIYAGYKKIILLGCDFNSFASRKELHCYEEDENKKMSLAFELFCYSLAADVHNEINYYAKAHNVEIINATYNSLIDSYRYDEHLVEFLKKKQEIV